MACKGGSVSSGNVLRIVLLGKGGSGKSSLGNTLTGKRPPKSDPKAKRDQKPPKHADPTQGFKVGQGLKEETVYCDWARGEQHGTVVEVTDTHGLCDTHLPEKDIYREVAKSVTLADPGPNVIIFTLRCDKRFTEEEEKAYKKIKQLFSETIKYFLILVFNGMDCWDDMETIEEQRECLDQAISKYGEPLTDMIRDAGGRYFGMNNKAPQEEKDRQVKDLIDMMNALVLRNGKDMYYHRDMTDEIMKRMEEIVDEEAKAKVSKGNVLRIVLLGKTGAGKSSLGNTLMGKRPPKSDPKAKRDQKPPKHADPTQGFKVGQGMVSETVYCDWARGERHGTVVEVTDTPGLCDTELDEKDIYREVAKSVALADPGPNVIIFALRCDKRFTPEEEKAYNKIKQLFSEAINDFLILVFNGLDCWDDMETIEEQRECLDQQISKFGKKLQDMVKEAGGRYVGMNNKAPQEEKERQVKDLIAMMNALVLKNGKDTCYHTDMTDEIMKRMEEIIDEETKNKGVDKDVATERVKQDIITEKVKPGFLTSIMSSVSKGAQRIGGGVSDMCSVM